MAESACDSRTDPLRLNDAIGKGFLKYGGVPPDATGQTGIADSPIGRRTLKFAWIRRQTTNLPLRFPLCIRMSRTADGVHCLRSTVFVKPGNSACMDNLHKIL